ncbi:MAG: hypothetical protein GW902_09320 [Alphaproteobacteria bacterium]|nr:hypothetical protein [Alphaproteobacteria bacterium]
MTLPRNAGAVNSPRAADMVARGGATAHICDSRRLCRVGSRQSLSLKGLA